LHPAWARRRTPAAFHRRSGTLPRADEAVATRARVRAASLGSLHWRFPRVFELFIESLSLLLQDVRLDEEEVK